MRLVLACLFCLAAAPLWAQCQGRDLLAEMPKAERAALVETTQAQPYPNGLLWRATRGAQVIDLVGTMHFHDPRHAATLAYAKPLIDAAHTVFLELGEGDEARLQQRITANPELAFITEGPTLVDLMPPPDWQRLAKAFRDRGMPGFMGAKMKPWMALLSLSLTKCVMQDVQAGKRGLDQMILDYAAQIGNPGQALEPYDTALSLFAGYSQAEMLEFLRLYLQLEGFDPDDQHHTMVEAYFRGEVRILWEFGVAQSLAQPQGHSPAQIRAEYARLEEALIGTRNRAWMARILAAVEEGPVFLAAGALHLPGQDGLLNLLEAEGFEISRISRE